MTERPTTRDRMKALNDVPAYVEEIVAPLRARIEELEKQAASRKASK